MVCFSDAAGLIGLGRMGANMARRLMRGGHECVVYDRSPDSVKALVGRGARGTDSPAALVAALAKPRAVWVMVPAGAPTEQTVVELGGLLEPGDVVIDGGNTYFKDDVRRARALAPKQVHYIDAGTSGGVFDLERGYCMMIGGDAAVVQRLDPIFMRYALPNSAHMPQYEEPEVFMRVLFQFLDDHEPRR